MEVGETVEFVHKPTGILVSTTGILNRQDDGWLEVDDNDNVCVIQSIFLRRQHDDYDDNDDNDDGDDVVSFPVL